MLLLNLKNYLLVFEIIICLCLLSSTKSFCQQKSGFVNGYITDGSTNTPLSGVTIMFDDTVVNAAVTSAANGYYVLPAKKGNYSILYALPGFQKKIISGANFDSTESLSLDIILYPLYKTNIATSKINDSISSMDSVRTVTAVREMKYKFYHPQFTKATYFDYADFRNFGNATDKNALLLLKRLRGVLAEESGNTMHYHSLNLFGMGDRYNQLLLNGSVVSSAQPMQKVYALSAIPVEVIEQVTVQKTGDAAVPADFAGGVVEIKTKDEVEKDFFHIQAGAAYNENTTGKDFYTDKRYAWEPLGFADSKRNLPAGFPTTRSYTFYNQKNLQEKVLLTKQLNNNLAASKNASSPGERVMIGIGKRFALKGGRHISLLAYINQQTAERTDEAVVQVLPNMQSNPFPFNKTAKLVNSVANDVNYRYTSQLAAVVNASIQFGRNKISFKNLLNSNFYNNYSQRNNIIKPDEDTLAKTGIRVVNEHLLTITSQVTGEHGFGTEGRLRINWLASYEHSKTKNPDERNFLLRQDGAKDAYEIATPQSQPYDPGNTNTHQQNFTNTGRLWRTSIDNAFTAALNIKMPVNLFNQPQLLSGGLYMQTKSRVFYSDFYLYKGKGYASLSDVLAPARYYPGGITVQNYFVNTDRNSNNGFLYLNNAGNYTGSVYTTASYLQMVNRFSKAFSLVWGLRFESNNQLISNTQYEYLEGYKNPQLTTINENPEVINFNFLPSAKLIYKPSPAINIYGAYFKTVNRPQMQALSDYRYYDGTSFTVQAGNPFLYNSNIHNADAGINWIPDSRSNFSLAVFYKFIDQPIENILSPYSAGNLFSMPHNTPEATVQGINASFNFTIASVTAVPCWRNLSLFGNATLLQSKAIAGPVRSLGTPDVPEHTLTGVPNYTVNTGIVWQQKKLPAVTVIYNRAGDYIQALGSGTPQKLNNGNLVLPVPHYRVKGREQLDVQISQAFYKSRLRLILGASNILSSPFIIYQDLNGNKKLDAPFTLSNRNGNGSNVYYAGGTDNTVSSIPSQANYYLNLSITF
jgi:TonB-dependent receptor